MCNANHVTRRTTLSTKKIKEGSVSKCSVKITQDKQIRGRSSLQYLTTGNKAQQAVSKLEPAEHYNGEAIETQRRARKKPQSLEHAMKYSSTASKEPEPLDR